MHKDVIIVGAGGHARVIADIITANGDVVFGFLDDTVVDPSVIGKTNDASLFMDKQFFIGIGNNAFRKKFSENFSNLDYYTAIHPSAVIGSKVKIGVGCCIMPNAVINCGSKIGAHCIINTSSVVEHDDTIDDYVHISPNATLCGTVRVGTSTHVGAGAVIKNNICICNDVIIGAGATVVSNISAPGIYVGTPAKLLENR